MISDNAEVKFHQRFLRSKHISTFYQVKSQKPIGIVIIRVYSNLYYSVFISLPFKIHKKTEFCVKY